MPQPQKRTFLGFEVQTSGNHRELLVFLGQLFACLGAGGWAGYAADTTSAPTLLVGGFGSVAVWAASLFAANAIGMMIASVTLAGRAVRWLRGKDALVPSEERHARDAREERRFYSARIVTMVPVLLILATVLAIVIWLLAADASLLAVLARHVGLAVLLSLLAPAALRATDELF